MVMSYIPLISAAVYNGEDSPNDARDLLLSQWCVGSDTPCGPEVLFCSSWAPKACSKFHRCGNRYNAFIPMHKDL